MKKTLLFLLLIPGFLFAQKTTLLKGIIKDKNNIGIDNVSIKYGDIGTTSDINGKYTIRIPLNKEVTIFFSHVSYTTFQKKIITRNRNIIRFSPVLKIKTESLNEIVVKDNKKEASGITKLSINKVKNTVGPNAGVENVLMTLPGVNNNNELSTQYNVRGGNFDENLVYVNGIQVYRPFLVRSGQQEGLSFINSNMVQNIDFSAGGFQAKYGDRLSSVLDITYRKPKEQALTIEASLLGASVTYEDVFLNNKLSAITSARYRDNSLFVNSKQIETNFRPRFTDIQTYLSYEVSKKIQLNFLSNFSLNNYNYKPLTRRTRFGTVADPLELTVFYSGEEKDKYLTLFGAISVDYKINKDFKLTTVASRYNTQEEEYFDILAQYRLGEVDTNIGSTNFGEVSFSEGIGSQLNHARNDLDALITNLEIKASVKKEKSQLNFGIKIQQESIKDRIREWEVIDSLGFSIRPLLNIANNQPYEPFEGAIVPFQNIRKDNNVYINRITSFLQFSKRIFWNNHEIFYNIGVRAHAWSSKGNGVRAKNQIIMSPRGQFAIKPDWNNDILFRFSGGLYAQPPSYRELRDSNGALNINVAAQKSIHSVVGMDYSFKLWNRPFKLTSEAYFKNLSDVNSYTVDNVRIRYRADNVTKAYVYGLDLRLNGEFVPGSESWVSLGFLKTEENINNNGYIARPSDQRVKFGVLFQDYVPNLPNLKAYLNLVYNSGVPGGAPSYANPYNFQQRLRDYRRADLGVSYIFADGNKQINTGLLSNFKEFSVGLELFNIFDIQNAITNTWVRDVYTKTQFGIPNYMTGRVLSFKVAMKL